MLELTLSVAPVQRYFLLEPLSHSIHAEDFSMAVENCSNCDRTSSECMCPPRVLQVVAAAVRTPDGLIHSMVPPARHDTIVHALTNMGHPQDFGEDTQGFLLSDGRFCRRKPALRIAEQAGQLLKPTKLPELYSEDVW